ncbi:MFS transporter [Aciditerrimonas ferrireducens]|uniref:MFS transporter n=1 Tax=Aciditerrimonas ferrireducens TaxID=667306 RepID=UPI0020068D0B|nr:MFS transporter [Aciditerrimonas ferrireducens]MCK4177515.1 MFS transporter [Aciditerrimonas ferrireducens]
MVSEARAENSAVGRVEPASGEITRSEDAGGDAQLVGMTWAHMVNDGAANYLPGVLPAVLLHAHEPLGLAGSLVAALAIGQVLQPLIGWVSDRLGGRAILVAGFVLTSTGGALLAWTRSLALLIPVLVVIGIGTSLFHPQALAVARSLTRGRRGLRTAFFLVGGELGRGLWPTLASLVVAHLGLGALWIIGLPGLLTVSFLIRWAPRQPPRPAVSLVPRRGSGPPGQARAFSLLVVYATLRGFAIFGLVTFVPVLWHLRGRSLVSGAGVVTTILVVGIVGNLGGGHLADRLGRRVVLVGSALAVAALVVPVGYLHGPGVWVLAGVLGCALFMTLSTTIMIGQDTFPESPSLGSGIALGLSNALGALVVLVVGLLIPDADVRLAFVAMGAASLLAAGVALGFPSSVVAEDGHLAP